MGVGKSAGTAEHSIIASFPGLPEISQVGWRLVLTGRHQVAISADAVHVTTDKDAIPDVLSAFETPFNLRYHTAVPLNGNVSNEYSGSLAYVISRLLDGYDR
jgi:hypothetical protein